MSESPAPFAELLARARRGDEAALLELARAYEPEVRIVAHVLLGPALRPYLDSLDLVQSVHRSLLLGLRQEKFDLSSPERLIALAVEMVRRKVGRHWRHLQRQNRLEGGAGVTPGPDLATNPGTEPDPARAAHLNDALARIIAQLDEMERRVVELRLEGFSTAEVARRLGLDADVLRVRLSRLRQRLRAAGLPEEAI